MVSPYYDPMLAKVIVHAPTRAEAARRLSHALARTQIHGLAHQPRAAGARAARCGFLAGQTDTHFLDRRDLATLAAPFGDSHVERLHAAAAALAAQAQRRREAPVLAKASVGLAQQPLAMAAGALSRTGWRDRRRVPFCPRGSAICAVGDHEYVRADCRELAPGQIELQTEGVRRTFDVHCFDDTYYVGQPARRLGAGRGTAVWHAAGGNGGRLARRSIAGRGQRGARRSVAIRLPRVTCCW